MLQECRLPFYVEEVKRVNTVEPIRDIGTVWDIADYLGQRSERNRVMFLFGIYVGIRISDILEFKVRDVKNRSSVTIREQKTGKEKTFPINDEFRPVLNRYIKGREEYEWLFPSRQGTGHIRRKQAYNIINEAGQHFGLERIGTHSMRKTFGYHFYQQTHDIVTLQRILNHSDFHITLKYIGIEQDQQDEAIRKLSFRKR